MFGHRHIRHVQLFILVVRCAISHPFSMLNGPVSLVLYWGKHFLSISLAEKKKTTMSVIEQTHTQTEEMVTDCLTSTTDAGSKIERVCYPQRYCKLNFKLFVTSGSELRAISLHVYLYIMKHQLHTCTNAGWIGTPPICKFPLTPQGTLDSKINVNWYYLQTLM